MVPPLATLPDDVLRARLRRAARDRMESTAPVLHARAGQACIEVMTELRRRGAPMWRDPDAPCGCGCGATGWAEPASQPVIELPADRALRTILTFG